MKQVIMPILILLCTLNAGAIHIEEIMYNPEGSDNNREFVEISMNFFTDLTNWTIADSNSNDTLIPLQLKNSTIALIVEEGFNYTSLNCSVYSAGATIGNSLNNKEDTILLYNSSLVDSVNYSKEVEGNSLILVGSEWQESLPSPCIPNNIIEKDNTSNVTNVTDKTNTTDKTNLTNKTSEEQNETLEIHVCRAQLNISTDKQIFDYGERVEFKHDVDTDFPFTITYWIESLHGDIEKEKYTTENLNAKSWTAKTEHEALVIKSILEVKCNGTYKRAEAERLIAVQTQKEQKQEEKFDNSIEILDINTGSDGEVEFGEAFTADVRVRKGETGKYSIKAYVESDNHKISETTRLHIHKENSETKISLPIAIKNNCNGDYNNGYYELVLEGLGEREEKRVYVNENNNCKEKVIYEERVIEKKKPEINSFYTLMQNYHETINLYATFNSINKSHDVILHSHMDKKIYAIENNDKIKLIANASPGKNIYILELQDNNITKDIRFIDISFPEQKPSAKHTSNKSYYHPPDNKITGKSVYESVEIKSKSKAKFLMAGVFLMLTGYMFYSREAIRKLFKRPAFFRTNGSANSSKGNNRNNGLSKGAYRKNH